MSETTRKGSAELVSEEKDPLPRSLDTHRSSLGRELGGCTRGLMAAVSEEKKDLLLRSLEMDRSSLERDVAAIRTWLAKQYHLPPVDSDELIKSYIIGCKGSLEKVKKKLDAYYSVRSLLPEIFYDRDPSSTSFQQFASVNCFVTMPRLTEDGCRLHVIWITTADTKHFDPTFGIKQCVTFMDIHTRTEAHVRGDYVIVPCTHCHIGNVSKITPSHFRNSYLLIENIVAMRFKGIFFINAPSIVETAVNNVFKILMSKKLRERVIVTSEDHNFLHRYFKKEILPKDFGGDEIDLKTLREMWLYKLIELKDWFIAESKLVTKEELRPKENKRDDLYGLDGTFRQLNID